MFNLASSDVLGPRSVPDVTFTFDGRTLSAPQGASIAAALLAGGIETCRRTPVSGSPRAPYCMMGVCFECLVVVDGIGNRQGCMIPVADGMVVETQVGARRVQVGDVG
jgi:predicted molibdopterin-dependent oxidoreductase YjgC